MTQTRFKSYPETKDSGIDWLGQVPAYWDVSRLKSTVASSQNGIWGDEPQGDDDDIACIRVADFDRQRMLVSEPGDGFTMRSVPGSQRAGRVLRQDDLLLEKSGGGEKQLVGAVVRYRCSDPAVCSNFVARVVPSDGHEARFLAYLHYSLYAARVNLRSIKQNTGIQNLDEKQYMSEMAALPPLPEQRTIADFLDRETAKIDALVEKKERLIELLQEKRTAQITHAVTKGLDPDVPMKDSGIEWLGQIPAHWGLGPIRSVLRERTEKNEGPKTDQVLSLVAGRGVIPYEEKGNLGNKKSDDIEKYKIVYPNDLVINSMNIGIGSFGVSQLYGATSQVYIICYPVSDASGWRFFGYVFHHGGFQEFLGSFGKGIMELRRAIRWGVMKNRRLPIPPIDEQYSIASFLDRETAKIDTLIAKVGEAIEGLKEYRTALISAAVTGKIDVRGLAGEGDEV